MYISIKQVRKGLQSLESPHPLSVPYTEAINTETSKQTSKQLEYCLFEYDYLKIIVDCSVVNKTAPYVDHNQLDTTFPYIIIALVL